MIRSLRVRILLAVSAIVVAAAAAVGLWSKVTVRREFDNFLLAQSRAERPAAVAALADHYRARGSWEGMDAVLDRDARVIVLDPAGKIAAAHPRELAAARLRMSGNTLRVEVRSGGRIEQLVLQGGGWPIRDARGSTVARVIVFPRRDAIPALRREFRTTVDRWLAAGVAVAAAAAVLILFTIFRRLFAPVEALTAGVRSLAAGRLDTRVAVRGEDEIAQLARAFNAMAEALERNDRARRNMVTDVAHELRTPLTNLRCEIEAVRDGLSPADAKFVESMAGEVDALGRLVDDLQQLSLAEAGKLRLDRERVEAKEVIARAVSGIERQAASSGIGIRTGADDGLLVEADVQRAVQIVRNLLLNAVAHARERVDVGAVREGAFVLFSITDDGPGVPAEHLERIFDRFHRVDASRSRRTGGAGLGLAIARELVALHGGTIAAENVAGGGARFTFTLPAV